MKAITYDIISYVAKKACYK